MSANRPEQRKSRRLPAEQVVASLEVVGVGGGNQAFALVKDVGRHGLCVRTPQPPDEGARVRIRIGLGETIHEFETEVRWVRPAGAGHAQDVGLAFVEDDAACRAFLAAFVESPHLQERPRS